MFWLWFGFLLLSVIWGTSWVAIKVSLEGYPPFLGAALRFFLASVFLASFARLRSISMSIPRGYWKVLVLSGLLLYLVDYGLIYWAEQHLSAGITAIFFSTFPLFTGLLSNFAFRSEPFRASVYAGLLIGFAGVILIFFHELGGDSFTWTLVWATSAVLVGAASGALSSLLVKKHLYPLHPVVLSFHQMMLGATSLLLIGSSSGEWSRVSADARAFTAVLYLGLAASALAFGLYYWLLQRLSPVTLSLLVYLTPAVAVLFDRLLLGQPLTGRTLTGMLIIFGGVLISQIHNYRAFLRRRVSQPRVGVIRIRHKS